jgi:hypothetical protein
MCRLSAKHQNAASQDTTIGFILRLFSHILLLPKKSQWPDFSPAYYGFRSEQREKLFSLLLNRGLSGSLLHYLSELLSTSNNVYEKSLF